MKEEYINRLYYLAKLKNYKGTRDEFVEKLQTDDSYFNYALYMARNDKVKYKGTDEEFSIAIGRTKPQSTQSETAATETAKVEEPIVKEEVKLEEPIAEEPVAEEPVIEEKPIAEEPIVEKKPAIQVKEVEAPKEEVVKKEIPKEALNQNIIPITDKTEVKAVETPSDKLVIKSKKKEEEFECPPGEKGCLKNQDVVDNYVTNNYRKNNLNYAAITDSEGRLAEFIDSGGGYGKSMTDIYKDEDYEHNKKGFMYAAEELPKSKRFSVFDIKLFGKDKSVIYDNKTGIILESTDDIIKNKQGDTVKVWLDVPMTEDSYGIIKEEIDAIKGTKKTEEKKPESKLEKYRNYKEEDYKIKKYKK